MTTQGHDSAGGDAPNAANSETGDREYAGKRMPFFSMNQPPERGQTVAEEESTTDAEVEVLPPPIDYQELIQRCLGNLEFAKKVLDKFDAGFGDGLRQLERQLSERNVNEIGRIAHRMKGAAANAATPILQQIVAQMEELSHGGRVHELNVAMKRLKDEWTRYQEFASEPNPWTS